MTPIDNIEELFRIAHNETRAGNLKKAVGLYKRIIELAKDDERAQHIAYWGIGEISLDDEQYAEAEYYLSKAIELAPYESSYHYLLGCTYSYTTEIDKSIKHLKNAVKLDGSMDIYWNQLGWIVGHHRNAEAGIEYLKKSLSINSKNINSYRDLCMLYTKSERFDEALVCIEEAIRLNPDNMELIRIKADIEFFKKEMERLSDDTI